MKLSIITINLNNRVGLQRTIESVINQTFTDYEWIVIDGDSTDGSKAMIEQYADHFAYWVSEPDKGIYNAMNKGIAHAKGEWLQFLNSGDSLYESTTLELVFSNEHNCDIIYGNGIHERSRDLIIYPSQLSLSYLIKHSISHQASFYKRYLYSKKLFDENYSVISDYISIIGFAITDKKFEYINQIIVNVEEGGISSSSIGTNEIKSLNHLIPSIIQKDIDNLNEYEKQLRFIQSHKSLKFVNNINNIIIHILGTIIRNIERQKEKDND